MLSSSFLYLESNRSHCLATIYELMALLSPSPREIQGIAIAELHTVASPLRLSHDPTPNQRHLVIEASPWEVSKFAVRLAVVSDWRIGSMTLAASRQGGKIPIGTKLSRNGEYLGSLIWGH